MKKRYWMCIIGPTDHDELLSGADAPMRDAVQDAFEGVTWSRGGHCYTGWDVTESQKEAILQVWCRGDESSEAILPLSADAQQKGSGA